MNTLLTTTGDGCAIVTATYTVDPYGEAEITAVILNGVDIIDALTTEQLQDMAIKAEKSHASDCALVAAELAIERMEG